MDSLKFLPRFECCLKKGGQQTELIIILRNEICGENGFRSVWSIILACCWNGFRFTWDLEESYADDVEIDWNFCYQREIYFGLIFYDVKWYFNLRNYCKNCYEYYYIIQDIINILSFLKLTLQFTKIHIILFIKLIYTFLKMIIPPQYLVYSSCNKKAIKLIPI